MAQKCSTLIKTPLRKADANVTKGNIIKSKDSFGKALNFFDSLTLHYYKRNTCKKIVLKIHYFDLKTTVCKVADGVNVNILLSYFITMLSGQWNMRKFFRQSGTYFCTSIFVNFV